MTPEIERLARKSRISWSNEFPPNLEHFAKLIAGECTKLCENLHDLPRPLYGPHGQCRTYDIMDTDAYEDTAKRIAAAIRARFGLPKDSA